MNRIALTLLVLLCTGCAGMRSRPVPVPSAPVLSSQEGKDSSVLAEAAKIDAIAPEAKPHTDAQRSAVASAPASEVIRLVRSLEAEIAQLQKTNTEKDAEILAAKNATDRTILLGGYAAAGLLIAAGVATFFLMAQVPFLGPRIGFSLLASGGSIFVMLQAFQWTKRHPWITGVSLLFLVVAGTFFAANYLHEKSKKPSS